MQGSHNKNEWPYYTRKVVQYLAFSFFIYLLLFLDPLTERDFQGNIFLRMSPLSAIGAMMAPKTFILNSWPALLVLFLAFPFGLFFCPIIAPMAESGLMR